MVPKENKELTPGQMPSDEREYGFGAVDDFEMKYTSH
jgi:hypothetical protein